MSIHVISLTFGSLAVCVTLVPLKPIDKSLTLEPIHASTYLQDYHRALTSLADTTSPNVQYPLHSILSYSRLSPSHRHFVMSISVSTEPNSYAEASRFDYWIKAMQAELQALQQNQT